MDSRELKELLDDLAERYNRPDFIADDPVSVPHLFTEREDIEIAGFLAATIAWGNRKSIVRNARRMMALMGDEPARFVREADDAELFCVGNFVHRTFNGGDLLFFLRSLRRIGERYGGIGAFFELAYGQCGDMREVLARFREVFFEPEHAPRVEKHLSSIAKKAACKRLNMYLRWMVRDDGRGVDFGLWRAIPPSALYLPLDVHSAAVGRELGLLKRRQNDWTAVEEITSALRRFDPSDPVRYDFALFGAGVNRVIVME